MGTSNEEAAYQGGVYGVGLKEDTKAVIIYGQEGDNTSNLRKAGYERALAEAGLEPVAMLSGNNTTDGATKVMEDLLQRLSRRHQPGAVPTMTTPPSAR